MLRLDGAERKLEVEIMKMLLATWPGASYQDTVRELEFWALHVRSLIDPVKVSTFEKQYQSIRLTQWDSHIARSLSNEKIHQGKVLTKILVEGETQKEKLTSVKMQPGLRQMFCAKDLFNGFFELSTDRSDCCPQVKELILAFAVAKAFESHGPDFGWKV